MSSILIMIVEVFFKLLELRGNHMKEGGSQKICVFVDLEKKRLRLNAMGEIK